MNAGVCLFVSESEGTTVVDLEGGPWVPWNPPFAGPPLLLLLISTMNLIINRLVYYPNKTLVRD